MKKKLEIVSVALFCATAKKEESKKSTVLVLRACVSLAFDARVGDVVLADGAHIALNVVIPNDNSIELLNCKDVAFCCCFPFNFHAPCFASVSSVAAATVVVIVKAHSKKN